MGAKSYPDYRLTDESFGVILLNPASFVEQTKKESCVEKRWLSADYVDKTHSAFSWLSRPARAKESDHDKGLFLSSSLKKACMAWL